MGATSGSPLKKTMAGTRCTMKYSDDFISPVVKDTRWGPRAKVSSDHRSWVQFLAMTCGVHQLLGLTVWS